MIIPNVSVSAEKNNEYQNSMSPWKVYPFRPPGTQIYFPNDEGSHDVRQFPIEWWYANFHLIGKTTGREYGSFVAFYHVQSTVIENREVRIFSISDIATGATYTNAQIGTLAASNDHLDLSFTHISDYDENYDQNPYALVNENILSTNQQTSMNINSMDSTMGLLNSDSTKGTIQTGSTQKANTIIINNSETDTHDNDFLQDDRWYTKTNDQGLIPFQYTLIVSGNSQQDLQPMQLAVDMDCLKQPLLVSNDGFLDLGSYGFSFYYSLTKLAITGTINLHGFSEEVIGYAWIDHQWGSFFDINRPPYGLTLTYEWFSLKLDDDREIMVADTWDRLTGKKNDQSFTDGINLVNSDGSVEFLKNYIIAVEDYWNDTTDHRFFSSKWHLTESSKSIDITITPVYSEQVIRVKEDYPFLQQILEILFPGACFWEGVCRISGTMNGDSISGTAYVELTHYSDNGNNKDLFKSGQQTNSK
jgi:predicted secreted hydrolase